MTRKPFGAVSPETQRLRTSWKKHAEKYSEDLEMRITSRQKEFIARFKIRVTPEQKEFAKKHGNISELFREYIDSLMRAESPDLVPATEEDLVPAPVGTGSQKRQNPDTQKLAPSSPDLLSDTEAHLKVRSSSPSLVSNSSKTLLDKEWDAWFNNLLPETQAEVLRQKADRAARRAWDVA